MFISGFQIKSHLHNNNNKKQLALSSLTWYQPEYFTHMPCVGLCLCPAPEMMSHLCGFWWWRVRLEVRGLLTIAIMSIFWSRGLWLPASCASCGLLGLRPEQASAYPRPPLPLIEPPPTHSWSSAPTVLPWNSHIKVLHLFVTRIANSHTHII